MVNKIQSKKGFPIRDLAKKTGASKESIHFYTREGLLPQPVKTARNVAYYTGEHVKRLEQIKELQKRFIPLKIIKRLLTAKGRELEEKFRELERRSSLPADILGPEIFFSFEDIKERTGLSPKELRKLEEMGVISSSPESEGNKYTREDLGLALIVSRLKEVGYSEERGFTGISGLALYITHVKEIVEEELQRFFSNLPKDLTPEETGFLADKGIELYSTFIALLRTKLIKQKGREIIKKMKVTDRGGMK